MDAAAKSVRVLTHDSLSQSPYYLSRRPDKRYPAAHDPRRFEEWYIIDLQYLTFLSDADRGVLLTRPEYDMREEPRPVARDADATPRAVSEKKKMTLSDYKNKKSTTPMTGANSTSPPEPLLAKKREAERASTKHGAFSTTPSEDRNTPSSAKRIPEIRRPDESRDSKPQRPREQQAADTRLPPKPPSKNSLPPKPPTPDNRKRLSDIDSESRPAKRSRPDDRLHPQRDNTPRQRDRDASYSTRDTLTPREREGRPANNSSLPNGSGRGLLKGASSAVRSTSPVSRSRGNSVNGVRHGATALASSRDTPTRNETSSKTSVPPLLSPLNLSMDANHDEPSFRADKKRREDATETARPSKPKPADPPPSGRKHKPPMELPPLLSPTLPPEVEAELERKKHAAEATERNHHVKNDRDSQHTIKKSRVQSYEEDDEDDIYEFSDKIPRKRFMVHLKIPRRLRPTLRKILERSNRKEIAARPERSIEQEASQSSQGGKKRPANTVETPSATTPLKRPRTTDTTASSSKLAAPATPSKRAVDMSRASSSNSLTYTPGDSSNMSSALASRLAAGDQYTSRLQKLDGAALKEKSDSMVGVARRLKREADSYMKLYHEAGGSHGSERPKESNLKMGCLFTLESIMAFMLGFYCQDLHRATLNKPGDADAWYSIFKFVESRRNEMKRYTPLFSILLLLRATADDQFLSSHSTHQEPDPKLSVQTILLHQRYRSKALGQLRAASSSIEDPELRPLLLPWATVDEIAFTSLRVMRRWASDEGIDWDPEINLK